MNLDLQGSCKSQSQWYIALTPALGMRGQQTDMQILATQSSKSSRSVSSKFNERSCLKKRRWRWRGRMTSNIDFLPPRDAHGHTPVYIYKYMNSHKNPKDGLCCMYINFHVSNVTENGQETHLVWKSLLNCYTSRSVTSGLIDRISCHTSLKIEIKRIDFLTKKEAQN